MFWMSAHVPCLSTQPVWPRLGLRALYSTPTCQLVTACASGGVALWRLDEEEESGRRVTRFNGHRAPVVSLDADAEKIVSGARDGTVCYSQMCTPARALRGPAILGGGYAAWLSASRHPFLQVRVWDSAASKLRFMLQGFTQYIGAVQIGPTGLMPEGTNNLVVMMDFSRGAAPAEGIEEDAGDNSDDEDYDDK